MALANGEDDSLVNPTMSGRRLMTHVAPSPCISSLSSCTRSAAHRHRLARDIGLVLFAWMLVSPAAGRNLSEEAQVRLDAVTSRLPDLGSEASAPERPDLHHLVIEHVAGSLVSVGPSNDSSVIADGLINASVNQGLSAGLDGARAIAGPFLGQLQGGLRYDEVTGRFSYDLLTVKSFYGQGLAGHNLLGQLGAHNQADRPTANLGLIYRWVDSAQSFMMGGNAFYDKHTSTGAERIGAGWEAVSRSFRVFANFYEPLSGRWRVAPSDDEREERPASGYDLGVMYTPARLAAVDLQLAGSRWKGDEVDVFGSGQFERDPTVLSFKAAYTPIPLVTASAEHSRVSGGEADTQVALNFTYRFGMRLDEQLRSSNTPQRIDIGARALSPVERNNRIVMETRDRYAAPPLFAGPALLREEIMEGHDYTTTLVVTGGTPDQTFALSGADAALFTYAGNVLRLAAKEHAAPLDADADNVYEVTITVTDRRARSAQKQVQVVVLRDLTDTDGDGWTDKEEIAAGTNPRDPNDPGASAGLLNVEIYANGAPQLGPPVVGNPLTAHLRCNAALGCPAEVAYQWELETAPGSGIYVAIAGATGAVYTPTADAQLRAIRVVAQRRNGG